jgi:cytochrome c2
MTHALLLVLLALTPVALLSCGREDTAGARTVQGGDAGRGRTAILRHGCGACHVIPGIRTARGIVGPALTDFSRRPYIAGVLLHDTLNLLRWLQDPPAIAPGTVMPRLGVSEDEARDIAAYLYRPEPGPARADPGADAAPGKSAPGA